MRTLGMFLLIISVTIVIYALNMDVTVSTAYSRVNNIGLMSSRQTYLIIAGALFIGSFIMIALGRSKGLHKRCNEMSILCRRNQEGCYKM